MEQLILRTGIVLSQLRVENCHDPDLKQIPVTHDDFNRRLHCLEGNSASSQKSSTSSRDDDGIHVRNLLKNLEASGSLTGEDVGMVEPTI